MKKLFLLAIVCSFIGCSQKNQNNMNTTPRIDQHSYAIPDEAVVTHLDLDLKANFDKKMLYGSASWTIDYKKGNSISFDTRNLDIQKVLVDDEEKDFSLGVDDEFLGQELKIPIAASSKTVTIFYNTRPDAAAVQWLAPIQTASKTDPFLFTQGQAILTRTWIPCQDSPGVRVTYDADIEVPSNLLAVMSASNPFEKNTSGKYHFEMKQAIPSYLIALAIGNLEFGAVGERTGIYAEPPLLEKSLKEFEDMEKMLIVAEELYGPYQWDRYDVIVLPPSFPFGGMENPRLTFATPTIIAGDKSLTSLIAHELAHSWSGNLVTNATWDDFWLNEGFTVYFERRIMEALYGEDYTNMLALLGYQDLANTVDDLGSSHADTHLHLDLKGRDPDDGMTDIAYEKGAYFLIMLENKVGKEKFDEFVKTYFETNKFKSMDTKSFVAYLNENLIDKYNLEVDVDEWIYGPGIPASIKKPVSDRFEKVDSLIEKYVASQQLDMSKMGQWSTHEWLHFIRHLPSDLPMESMKFLDDQLSLSDSGNAEILAAWYELSIRNGYYKSILPKIEKFLVSVGRRKFLTPLYRAMKEADDIQSAQDIYAKARSNYHAVSIQTMDALLDWPLKKE